MFIFSKTAARSKNRTRSARVRAKFKAKNRRRVNRMAGTRLSAKRTKKR